MHHVDADLVGEPDALGPAGHHRLGPDVDQRAADLVTADLPARPVGRLEHDDVVARGHQVVGGRQAGDAGSDHDDPHS